MYDRFAAARYARKWALSRNVDYYDFSMLGGDCTNFASQCIFAGSGAMNFTPVTGWYYINLNNRTPSWTGVGELYDFLINNSGAGPKAVEVTLGEIQTGDIIQLRFPGMKTFSHSPVVLSPGLGIPETILVAAHTNDALDRALNTYLYAELRPLHIL